jgi:predicted dehydrogenase
MTASSLILEKIPVFTPVDVLVAGGGSAGGCAAIAAASEGVGAMRLIGRDGFLGGTSTQMLDPFDRFFTLGAEPRKVVGGGPDRVINALDAAGAVFRRPNTYGTGTGVNDHPERLELVRDELLARAGVRVRLPVTWVAADHDAGGRIVDVVMSTKTGFFRSNARRFIDASGDADLCHLADVADEKAGEPAPEPEQTRTMTFRRRKVDLPADYTAGGKRMLLARMDKAVERGMHALPRQGGSFHEMTARGGILAGAVRVVDGDGAKFPQFGAAQRAGRRQALIYGAFFRDGVPGFSAANILGLSHQIRGRETRRVYGEDRLTKENGRTVARFDDRGWGVGAPAEDYRVTKEGGLETVWAYAPGGQTDDVPDRTLMPRRRGELWGAGRGFAPTHDAHVSCRSMAQTLAKGQAAGTAAGLHVYPAKPVTVDVSGCQSIAASGAAAHSKGPAFLVDFQTHANDFYREAICRRPTGAIGELCFGESSYPCGRLKIKLPQEGAAGRLHHGGGDQALSGDIMVEQNVHTLDVMSWIMKDSPPTRGTGTGGRRARVEVGNSWDHFALVDEYPNRFGATFSSRPGDAHGSPKGILNLMVGSKGVLMTAFGGDVMKRGAAETVDRGGKTSGFYQEGGVANLRAFHQQFMKKDAANGTVAPSVTSTLVGMMGRMAAHEGRSVSRADGLASQTSMHTDLTGLKA